ncbi:MAG TPA: carboxypeptidase-like regulatory domain-containing protein [Gemmatimonadaceae bacterium]|nr:carboxypeptidase-like regulatory domain-containing protein [Gemmatimonadaceae bacterium]
MRSSVGRRSRMTRGATTPFRANGGVAAFVFWVFVGVVWPRTASQAQSQDTARAVANITLRGVVVRTGDGAPVAGADVWLASLDRHATTDSAGAFVFTGLPEGAQLLQIRRVGFDALRDVVRLSPAQKEPQRFALATSVNQLDTVHTTSRQRKYISPGLQGFEERRLSGQGGYFISDSVLRANDYKTLASVIESRVPGTQLTASPLGYGALASTRKSCRGLAMNACTTPNCFSSVYLDGALVFYPGQMDVKDPVTKRPIVSPPDMYKINVSDLGGVEFYSGGASAPVGMHSSTDEGCGTLWLWTREK